MAQRNRHGFMRKFVDQELKQPAEADGVAMNQYVAIALAEKISARKTAADFLPSVQNTAACRGRWKF